jgi:hypothetical protein
MNINSTQHKLTFIVRFKFWFTLPFLMTYYTAMADKAEPDSLIACPWISPGMTGKEQWSH